MGMRWAMISAAALLFAGCVVEPGYGPGVVVAAGDPYYYSPNYCAGCWYGEWSGRTGYHRGGGRPWEREHVERDHHGHDYGGDIRHDGHR